MPCCGKNPSDTSYGLDYNPALRDSAPFDRTIWVFGYPCDVGGAGAELWHTLKLWRRFGCDVHLVPTWNADKRWRDKVAAIGCHTHDCPDNCVFESIPGLAGATVVSFCNQHFVQVATRLKHIGCKLVWANCMTGLFDYEIVHTQKNGPFDAYMFQSDYQQGSIAWHLAAMGVSPSSFFRIPGAFDFTGWDYCFMPHKPGETFRFGRAARPDHDKWSSKMWGVYAKVNDPKQAVCLGFNSNTAMKCGMPPTWAKTYPPGKILATDFFRGLHAYVPINGKNADEKHARENWPRTTLEAFASGVPVVAENAWGLKEQIKHGETGFLADSDDEIAEYVNRLAADDDLRKKIADAAREAVVHDLADPWKIWDEWKAMLDHAEGK